MPESFRASRLSGPELRQRKSSVKQITQDDLSENADDFCEEAMIGDLKQSLNDYRTISPLVSLKPKKCPTAYQSSSEDNSFLVMSGSKQDT